MNIISDSQSYNTRVKKIIRRLLMERDKNKNKLHLDLVLIEVLLDDFE